MLLHNSLRYIKVYSVVLRAVHKLLNSGLEFNMIYLSFLTKFKTKHWICVRGDCDVIVLEKLHFENVLRQH